MADSMPLLAKIVKTVSPDLFARDGHKPIEIERLIALDRKFPLQENMTISQTMSNGHTWYSGPIQHIHLDLDTGLLVVRTRCDDRVGRAAQRNDDMERAGMPEHKEVVPDFNQILQEYLEDGWSVCPDQPEDEDDDG